MDNLLWNCSKWMLVSHKVVCYGIVTMSMKYIIILGARGM